MARTGRIATKLGGYGSIGGKPVGPSKPKVLSQHAQPKTPALPRPPKPKTVAPAAPAAPAAPVAPAPAPPKELPVDPTYDAAIASLARRRDDTFADLANTQTAGLANYGYNASFDDKGGLTGLNFDPNNPNSRAALLKRHALQARQGTSINMASRGKLYSGALLNAQNQNDFAAQNSEDQLRKQLGDFLTGIANRKRTAGTDYETGAGTAYGERLSRVDSNPLYDPAAAANSVPPVMPGQTGKDYFANLKAAGGTLVIKGGKSYVKYKDGRLVPVK